jgi:hypothetical protein
MEEDEAIRREKRPEAARIRLKFPNVLPIVELQGNSGEETSHEN